MKPLSLRVAFLFVLNTYACYNNGMDKKLPTKTIRREDLRQVYDKSKPLLTAILNGIQNQLKNTLNLASTPMYKARVKSFNSYYKKLLRIKPPSLGQQDLPVLTDLLGIRVICAFLEDLQEVEKQIVQNFSIVEIERKGADKSFSEFGYESLHILIEIPEKLREFSGNGDSLCMPNGLVCEIQIRTILQDAWAEVEHELVYKSEFSPFDLPLRRKLASINATLSLADIIFQEIRDYQNKLNSELDYRREAFYEKADFLARERLADLSYGTGQVELEHTPPSSPYVRGTIDDMILDAIHAHNTGDLDKAVQIYTVILNTKPEPNNIVLSVIHKHRGMAYFAKNMYLEALNDFNSSIERNPNNASAYYYLGIVCAVQNRDEDAIGNYNTSLELNPYQSHVLYRRALAKYNLCNFTEAMEDLKGAMDLGLNDADVQRLYDTLSAKLELQF